MLKLQNTFHKYLLVQKFYWHKHKFDHYFYICLLLFLLQLSISASLKTINGALPPNSIEILFTELAESFINILPTSVEPVKDIFLTEKLSHNSFPIGIGLLATNKLITPFGIPAFSAKYTNALADKGVCSAGLIITLASCS